MTVEQLIAEVLNNLRNHFYADRIRDFKRDERALTKAIATYGTECHARGWDFDCRFIFKDLCDLLLKIRTSGAVIEYLPVYLSGAIRQRIRERAEELSSQARQIRPRAAKIVGGLKTVEAIRQPTDVEIFAAVAKGIRKINKAQRRAAVKAKQPALL